VFPPQRKLFLIFLSGFSGNRDLMLDGEGKFFNVRDRGLFASTKQAMVA